jgi:cytochrome c biogenesis protein CcmG, thiol:disulfide interchange protein DsbE
MNRSPAPQKRSSNLMVILIAGGFMLGIGAGFLSTLFSPAQSRNPATSQQTATSAAASTPVPPTPTLFLPTLPDGLPAERDAAAAQVTLEPILEDGKLAPNFTLKTLDGKEVSLADYAGKPVLINVWATWCPPCRDEMTAIQAAYEKHGSQGLVVLGINLSMQDTRTDVDAFVKELKLTFPILLDETGSVSSAQYGVHALPVSFFIDTRGVIQRTTFGGMLPAELESYLASILPK